MRKIRTCVDKILAHALIVLMVMLVVCVVWQVASRYLLKRPSSVTDELARFILIWEGLLGAAYVVGLGRHLNIDLLLARFGAGTRRLFNALSNLVVALFSLVVVFAGGTGLVVNVLAQKQMASAMRFPMGYVYLVLPISGALMAFYGFAAVCDEAAAWRAETGKTAGEE